MEVQHADQKVDLYEMRIDIIYKILNYISSLAMIIIEVRIGIKFVNI